MAVFDDTRADWNARPPLKPRTLVPWSQRIGVSWHWIGPGRGPSPTGPHSSCLAQVRDWQAQHQANTWKDIGYNALICQHGRAIEGRGLEYSGSHSPGVNTSHIGIQFMVGDKSGGITPVMVARAQRLRADIGALGKNIRRDWGHRDDTAASTECPGDDIYQWVHSGGPTKAPATTTPAPPPEDDMPTMPELTAALLTKADGDTLRKDIGYARDQVIAANKTLQATVTSLQATVAGQAAAISALAADTDVDADSIKADVQAAVQSAISGLEVTLAVKPEVQA